MNLQFLIFLSGELAAGFIWLQAVIFFTEISSVAAYVSPIPSDAPLVLRVLLSSWPAPAVFALVRLPFSFTAIYRFYRHTRHSRPPGFFLRLWTIAHFLLHALLAAWFLWAEGADASANLSLLTAESGLNEIMLSRLRMETVTAYLWFLLLTILIASVLVGSYGITWRRLRAYTILFIISGFVICAPRNLEARPKNFIIILADDLGEIGMPHRDALRFTYSEIAGRGMEFRQAFASSPACCPSRANLLTGLYNHNTGVYTNFGPYGGWPAFHDNGNENRTVACALQKGGYRTAYFGKYLHTLPAHHLPVCWDDWRVSTDFNKYIGYDYEMNINGELRRFGDDESDYFTDKISAFAKDFINTDSGANPFLLLLFPTSPHFPLPPARRHLNHPWQNASLPDRPNFMEDDLSDKPFWLRVSAHMRRNWRWWHTAEYRSRMGSLLALDDLTKTVVESLKEKGILDDTVIIFTSDQGYNLGAHNLIHKMVPYEESIRVPFLVRGPGVVRGINDSEMILLLDIFPTLLDFANLPKIPALDGASFRPLLRGQQVAWRNNFIITYKPQSLQRSAFYLRGMSDIFQAFFSGQDVPAFRALRTADRLFIEWYEPEDFHGFHEYELYDLKRDPYELNNLLSRASAEGRAAGARANSDAALKRRTSELQSELDRLSHCRGADCFTAR